MEHSIAKKLKARGLDTDFLCWLEGEADRLPRWAAVRKLKPEQLVAAIRAVVWLRQLDSEPEVIAPHRKKHGLLPTLCSKRTC